MATHPANIPFWRRIRDHRGACREILLRPSGGAAQATPRPQIAIPARVKWAKIILLMVIILVLWEMIGMKTGRRGGPVNLSPWTFLLVASPVLLGLAWYVWPPRMNRAIAHARIQEMRCAACAYELRGLAPQPDGCTLCPECGAAWKTPRLQ